MFFQQNYYVNTTAGVDISNITHEAKRALRESRIKNGVLTVLITYGAAGVALLENDPSLWETYKDFILNLIPEPEKKKPRPKRRSGTGYDFAHLRGAFIGASISMPVKDEKLEIGYHQEIVLFDFDDRVSRREISIHIVGDGGSS